MPETNPTKLLVSTGGWLATEDIAKAVKNAGRKQEFAAVKVIKAGIQSHLAELLANYIQCITHGPYGRSEIDLKKWRTRRKTFISSVLGETMGARATESFANKIEELIDEAMLTEFGSAEKASRIEVSAMSGIEFEHHCADILRAAGWAVSATAASGDQGIDLLASGNGTRVAIQCKRLSKPVGNAAVQEAHAGRAFAGAHFSAVATNATFTPAARQAAAKTGTLLVHVDELHELEVLIQQARRR